MVCRISLRSDTQTNTFRFCFKCKVQCRKAMGASFIETLTNLL